MRLEPGMYESKGKYANHSAMGTIRDYAEYLVFV